MDYSTYMYYYVLIAIVTGVYKPTHNVWGPHIVDLVFHISLVTVMENIMQLYHCEAMFILLCTARQPRKVLNLVELC